MAKLTKKEKEEQYYQFLINLGRQYSKKNRENATKWEIKLSKLLSNLHVRFDTQVPHIHNKKKLYILDVVLTDYNIVLEVDSKQHHTSKEDVKNDKLRTRRLKKDGFYVVRLWNSQITLFTESDLERIIELAIEMLKK